MGQVIAVLDVGGTSIKTGAVEFSDDTDFLEDLKATSVQFFPIIAALEDEFDIEIQYQDFRRNGKTVKQAIDFVEKLAR